MFSSRKRSQTDGFKDFPIGGPQRGAQDAQKNANIAQKTASAPTGRPEPAREPPRRPPEGDFEPPGDLLGPIWTCKNRGFDPRETENTRFGRGSKAENAAKPGFLRFPQPKPSILRVQMGPGPPFLTFSSQEAPGGPSSHKKSKYMQQNHGSKALSKTLFENTGQKVFRNRFTKDPRNPIGSVAGLGAQPHWRSGH